MLNLDEAKIPSYEFTLKGQTHTFDPIVLGSKLESIYQREASDLASVAQLVAETLELELEPYQALMLLKDFTTFAETQLEEPLKKALGRSPFSTTTTVLDPKSASDSPSESITD